MLIRRQQKSSASEKEIDFMTSVAAMISALRPIMDLAEPILKAKPEVCEESHLDN